MKNVRDVFQHGKQSDNGAYHPGSTLGRASGSARDVVRLLSEMLGSKLEAGRYGLLDKRPEGHRGLL
jgi:hypothetical protein